MTQATNPTPASPAQEGEFNEMRCKGKFLPPVGVTLTSVLVR